MKTKKTAEEITEDLKVGMDNRAIDEEFAREREKLDKKINALREELNGVRTKVQFGDNEAFLENRGRIAGFCAR